MADSQPSTVRTDGLGHTFVCEAQSPDGSWHVELFADKRRPWQFSKLLWACARQSGGRVWSFCLGPNGSRPPAPDQISFRWDLPNGSWGVFIDGECWAVYVNRPARRGDPE